MDNLNDSRGSDYHENFMLETVFNHEGEVGLYSTGLYGISCKYCVNNEWIDI